jgi:hypothetical protein
VSVYADAIRRAREAFDLAPSFGFDNMRLLDVGGGFTAPYDEASAALFYRTAAVINGWVGCLDLFEGQEEGGQCVSVT